MQLPRKYHTQPKSTFINTEANQTSGQTMKYFVLLMFFDRIRSHTCTRPQKTIKITQHKTIK